MMMIHNHKLLIKSHFIIWEPMGEYQSLNYEMYFCKDIISPVRCQ